MYRDLSGSQGFSLLSVLIAVMLIGIMSSIAVPKFNAAIASANTAKIQSDLTNIDAAIVMYRLDMGKEPTKMQDLEKYLTDYQNVKPPQGNCYLKGNAEAVAVPADSYTLKKINQESRAVCGENTAGAFGKGTGSAPTGDNG